VARLAVDPGAREVNYRIAAGDAKPLMSQSRVHPLATSRPAASKAGTADGDPMPPYVRFCMIQVL
jgi:hypothetical protein